MKVFGLMLREDCTDWALREALARDSTRQAARGALLDHSVHLQ